MHSNSYWGGRANWMGKVVIESAGLRNSLGTSSKLGSDLHSEVFNHFFFI